jgi:hypothetical protein
VQRQWLVAKVAKEFGVLPSQAARAMDADPEGIDLIGLGLLRYAEAHAAYRRADKTELKAWQGSKVMAMVEENDFADARDRMKGTETEA